MRIRHGGRKRGSVGFHTWQSDSPPTLWSAKGRNLLGHNPLGIGAVGEPCTKSHEGVTCEVTPIPLNGEPTTTIACAGGKKKCRLSLANLTLADWPLIEAKAVYLAVVAKTPVGVTLKVIIADIPHGDGGDDDGDDGGGDGGDDGGDDGDDGGDDDDDEGESAALSELGWQMHTAHSTLSGKDLHQPRGGTVEFALELSALEGKRDSNGGEVEAGAAATATIVEMVAAPLGQEWSQLARGGGAHSRV